MEPGFDSNVQVVVEIYGVLLQRHPQLGELAMCRQRLMAGSTVLEVIREMFFSEEYQSLQKPTVDFVRDLYCTLLGRDIRPPERTNVAEWVARAEQHGRASTFEVFTLTAECEARTLLRR